MADALDTHSLNMRITDVIDNAKTRLVIISPYLSIYNNLRKNIKLADNKGINIIVVYRKIEENSDVLEWLSSLKHVYIGQSDNLHAKYYGEDDGAVITSMNLYEYSQVNNEELGIFIESREDTEAFYDMVFFIRKIIEMSKPIYSTIKFEFYEEKKLLSRLPNFKFSMLKEPINNIPIKESTEMVEETTTPNEVQGFCIRCGKKIDSESDVYYCNNCYTRWKQYKNPNYQEKYCHICGKPAQTSAYKPVCKECFPGSSDIINKKKDAVLKEMKTT